MQEENTNEYYTQEEIDELEKKYRSLIHRASVVESQPSTKEHKLILANILCELGEVELEIGKTKDAIQTLEKGYNIFNEVKIVNREFFTTLYYLSSAYFYKKDLHNAIDCLECYIKVAKRVDHPQDSNMLTVMDDLASYYEAHDGTNKNSLPLREKVSEIMRMSSKSGIFPDISFDN